MKTQLKHFFIVASLFCASMSATFMAMPFAVSAESGNSGNSGGVVEKRIKTVVDTSTRPILGPVRNEYSYNDDGTLKRVDIYDESSKRVMYMTYTHNSDGTRVKHEMVDEAYGNTTTAYDYSYNADKTLQKVQGTIFLGGVAIGSASHDYTYQNGRKTREVIRAYAGGVLGQEVQFVYDYDSNGKRTTSIATPKIGVKITYTRTYNEDGTLQKVTHPSGQGDNAIITKTFTWEDGKSTVDEDIFFTW